MRAPLIIVLSLLPAFVIGEEYNACRQTSRLNCFDNVGQPCGNDVNGDPIRDGNDICCYVRGEESGVVKCSTT